MRAVVLGGADTLADDLAAALELFTPDLVVATNHAGMDHPGPVDHWCSFHVELMPRWIAAREAAGRPPAGQLWTVERRHPDIGIPIRRVPNWGGSSGMVAVTVALHVGCTRVVCCGVPLDSGAAHYDDPEPWRDAGNYRKAWLIRQTQLTAVRSMSGYTRQILGAPTKEWLDGKG